MVAALGKHCQLAVEIEKTLANGKVFRELSGQARPFEGRCQEKNGTGRTIQGTGMRLASMALTYKVNIHGDSTSWFA